jgi:hypothetical protein
LLSLGCQYVPFGNGETSAVMQCSVAPLAQPDQSYPVVLPACALHHVVDVQVVF